MAEPIRFHPSLEPLLVPLDDVHPYPGNPRRGNLDVLEQSIRANGFVAPVIAQRSTGHIVAGNHRWQVLSANGEEKVPVVYVDMTDTEARRYLLADNRTADLGTYDDPVLAELLASVQTDTGGLHGTGYTGDDVDALLAQLAADSAAAFEDLEGLTDEALDDAPPPPEPQDTITRPGGVWALGPHRLICGDGTDPDVLAELLAGRRADAMWTDPPYGVEYVGGNHAVPAKERLAQGSLTIANDGKQGLPDLLTAAFEAAKAVVRPGSPFYVAMAPGPQMGVTLAAATSAGYDPRQILVWVKNTIVLGHSDYHYRHEPILYGFSPGGSGRRGRGAAGWYGGNDATTVLEFPKPGASREHPTMKPIALVRTMLDNSLKAGGLVLDPFAGSGTTMLAVRHRGAARMVELDPRYCDVIARRYQQATGQPPALDGHDVDMLEHAAA